MTVHGYLVLGSDSHLAASGEDAEDLIEDIEFPNQEALYWFRLGMNRADGCQEAWLFDSHDEAVEHVHSSIDDYSQDDEGDSDD